MRSMMDNKVRCAECANRERCLPTARIPMYGKCSDYIPVEDIRWTIDKVYKDLNAKHDTYFLPVKKFEENGKYYVCGYVVANIDGDWKYGVGQCEYNAIKDQDGMAVVGEIKFNQYECKEKARIAAEETERKYVMDAMRAVI